MLSENSFERLSDDIIEAAENVTLSILERLQKIARLLVENPETNINREAVRREVEGLWEQYFTQAQQWTDESLPQAYLMGIERANAETPDTEAPFGFNPQPIILLAAGISAGGGTISPKAAEFLKDYPKHHTMYTAFQDAAYSEFQKTRLPVVRDTRGKLRDLIVMASEDAYKDADGFTRRKMTQRLMNKFADDNITGIQYSDGRTMKLDTYSEMVARSQTGNAARQAALNRQQEYGLDLIQISQHFPTSPLCEPWQARVYSLSGTSSKYPSFDVTQPGSQLYHANCVVGDSIIDAENISTANVRRYKGEVVIIKTSSGNKITVTPNHPILTSSGWVPAKLINPGDNLISYIPVNRVVDFINPNKNKIHGTASQIFRSLKKSFPFLSSSMPVSTTDFHGDGVINKDVNIVSFKRLLGNNLYTGIFKPINYLYFILTYSYSFLLSCFSSLTAFFKRNGSSTGGFICIFSKILSFFSRHSRKPFFSSIRSAFSSWYSGPLKLPDNNIDMNAKVISNRLFCFPGIVAPSKHFMVKCYFRISNFIMNYWSKITKPNISFSASFFDSSDRTSEFFSDIFSGKSGHVKFDNVINCDREFFHGSVYNFETDCNWYITNNIVTRNCKHFQSPYIEGTSILPEKELNTKENRIRYEAEQRQREIERRIRKYKRREASAITDQARKEAKGKIKQWQKAQRDHVDKWSHLRRKYARESV